MGQPSEGRFTESAILLSRLCRTCKRGPNVNHFGGSTLAPPYLRCYREGTPPPGLTFGEAFGRSRMKVWSNHAMMYFNAQAAAWWRHQHQGPTNRLNWAWPTTGKGNESWGVRVAAGKSQKGQPKRN